MDIDVPDVPTRSHRSSQRRSIHAANTHASSSSDKYTRRNSGAVSSPDIINNLITSLSIISEPASSHFDAQPTASTYASPNPNSNHRPSSSARGSAATGSFGVEYGAYSKTLDGSRQDAVDLDEVAATAPVVRTSKTPSRISSSTAKSPRSSSRDSGSAIRAYLRSTNNSRPSSAASTGSRNDDTRSIGNLSIERGSGPSHELRPRRSYDSWGKKLSRGSKGLMYMPSKERLRDRDSDRKWTQPASMASSVAGASSLSGGGRGDAVLAETTIREEPRVVGDITLGEYDSEYTQPVPSRNSSLRGHRKQRSSARRSTRNSEDRIGGAILEADEIGRSPTSPPYTHARTESETARRLFNVDERIASARALSEELYGSVDEAERQRKYAEELDEDGAPFPAISNGRRRWERSQDRSSGRLSASGRLSPAPVDDPLSRRSSSRLQRLSGQLSPRSEPRTREHSTERRNLPAGYERPDSADSVDGAVESYLCSPRLSQKIKHPQTGRIISFSEVGDPEGSAVFCCVGMGLTRYITAFYDELALTLKLRLITPDRPGVGDSEPYTDGATTPLSWPDDVYAICQALKITKFSILAHSAGAIYALATALRMPQHIRGKIHLLAPWIPPSQMNVFGSAQADPPTHSIPTSQRILRALPTPLLKAANSSFMSATSASLTSSLPKNQRRNKRKTSGQQAGKTTDKENGDIHGGQANGDAVNGQASLQAPNATENMDRMQRPQAPMNGETGIAGESEADKERQQVYDIRLTHAIWDLATTGANPAVDLLVCLERRHAIGFRYVDITRPVVIHHGSKDNRVPVDNIKWLGKAMRRCEVRVLEGEGHGLMASAVVMGSVLMEMSKEWEDWMRVTGADGRKDRERERGRKVR